MLSGSVTELQDRLAEVTKSVATLATRVVQAESDATIA